MLDEIIDYVKFLQLQVKVFLFFLFFNIFLLIVIPVGLKED